MACAPRPRERTLDGKQGRGPMACEAGHNAIPVNKCAVRESTSLVSCDLFAQSGALVQTLRPHRKQARLCSIDYCLEHLLGKTPGLKTSGALMHNYLDLAGKVALVTGASSGIGAATAAVFADLGAHVAMGYHRNEKGAGGVRAQIAATGAKV